MFQKKILPKVRDNQTPGLYFMSPKIKSQRFD